MNKENEDKGTKGNGKGEEAGRKRSRNDLPEKCKNCEIIKNIDDCETGCGLIDKRLRSRP